MKLQYLGDSKDAFKWDYLDFLTKQMGMSELLIVPMLTPKGKSKKKEWFVNNDSFRRTYFSNISEGGKTVLFLDPDKGFETKHLKNTKEHHVKYCDIKNIYNDAKKDDIIVVFQHAPHNIPFPFREKYKDIVRKLTAKDIRCDKTALFWCNQVMFVIIGKSSELINKIRKMNESYQKLPRPVEVIRGDAG